VEVACYAGSRYPQRPQRLTWRGSEHEVLAVEMGVAGAAPPLLPGATRGRPAAHALLLRAQRPLDGGGGASTLNTHRVPSGPGAGR
jgi:hypothetical protein